MKVGTMPSQMGNRKPTSTRRVVVMTIGRPSVLVLAVVMVCSLAGCSQGPAVLPGPDPLCEVFPSDQIAEMLPPGTYDYYRDRSKRIAYGSENVYTFGSCFIRTPDNDFDAFYVGADLDLWSTKLDKECRLTTLDGLVTPPRVGQIVDSGQCPTGFADQYEAWALFWGGHYDGAGHPMMTLIDAQLDLRKGRDGLTDSVSVVQMVLDFIDRSYAASPPSGPPEVPPSTVPYPSSSPTSR